MRWMAMIVAAAASGTVVAEDSQIRDVTYDAAAVLDVPVKRGVLTLITLDEDEFITDLAAGLGGDCAKPESTWCVAGNAGGRRIFVKPKRGAQAANTLAVITDKRVHSFRLVLLSDRDRRQPLLRLQVNAPRPPAAAVRVQPLASPQPAAPAAAAAAPDSDADVIAERLRNAPSMANSSYSVAEGEQSADIVPTLVFDDGRFTYLRLPGNRELPAVFQVQSDGSETLVNVRMEGDLLVVDRVSRRLHLRAGSAVVAVWNDDFDLEGSPPLHGTAAPGVARELRTRPVAGSPSEE